MKLRLIALFLAASIAAVAADADFERIVKAVETRFDTRKLHIPMMGLANFVLKVGHPAGTSSLKVAIFEDLHSTDEDMEALDDFMAAVDSRLHSAIRVHNRNSGESTYIFIGDVGKSTRVLVATFERNEATIVEVKANVEALMKILGDPEKAGKMFGHGRDCCSE